MANAVAELIVGLLFLVSSVTMLAVDGKDNVACFFCGCLFILGLRLAFGHGLIPKCRH